MPNSEEIRRGCEPARSAVSIEQHNVVNRGMSSYQRSRTWLKHPRNAARGMMPLDRVDNGKNVNSVADRTHHDDADAIELVLRHFASSAILSPSAAISDSSIGSLSRSRRLRSDLLSRAMFACRTIGSPGT